MYIPGTQNRGRSKTPVPDSKLTHRDESTLGVFAVTLNSGYTLVPVEHKARLTEAAFLAGGGVFEAGDLTVLVQVGAGWDAGRKAAGVVAVVWARQSYRMEGYEVSARGCREPRK